MNFTEAVSKTGYLLCGVMISLLELRGAPTETRTHDPLNCKATTYLLCHDTRKTIHKLKRNQLLIVLFISTSLHAAEFCRVFSIVVMYPPYHFVVLTNIHLG